MRLITLGFALVFGSGLAHADEAKDLIINGSAQSGTRACQAGQNVVVNGSKHDLKLTGECARVTVNGSDNVVGVEAAAKLTVSGMGHTVTWQRGAGDAKAPKIVKSGMRHRIAQGNVTTP